jgi:hypothetical protein
VGAGAILKVSADHVIWDSALSTFSQIAPDNQNAGTTKMYAGRILEHFNSKRLDVAFSADLNPF